MNYALGENLFRFMCLSYAGALASYISSLASTRKLVARLATGLALTGLVLHTSWLLARWYHAGIVETGAREAVGVHLTGYEYAWTFISHPPYTNLYESLIFVSWCLMTAYMIMEAKWKVRPVGILATGLVLCALTEAFIVTEKELNPLVPALQSWWILIHVAMLFISYSLFLLAAAFAILFLMKVKTSTSSLGLGFTTAGAIVLMLTGGKALFTKLAFEITPLFQHSGKWMAVHHFPAGAEKAVRWNVNVPGVGPLMALSILALVGAAFLFFREVRAGTESGTKGLPFKLTAAGMVFSAAAVGALLYSVLASGPIPMPQGVNFAEGVQGPFKMSFQSNYGLGLPILTAAILATYLALVVWQEPLVARLPDHKRLDDMAYKVIVVGFPMLSFGIVMGALWAYDAWGRYWGWDPKETWALITWFIYAIYLHTRVTLGWTGKPGATIAVVGFAFVIFTYMGVNLGLTGEGLHTYGSG